MGRGRGGAKLRRTRERETEGGRRGEEDMPRMQRIHPNGGIKERERKREIERVRECERERVCQGEVEKAPSFVSR